MSMGRETRLGDMLIKNNITYLDIFREISFLQNDGEKKEVLMGQTLANISPCFSTTCQGTTSEATVARANFASNLDVLVNGNPAVLGVNNTSPTAAEQAEGMAAMSRIVCQLQDHSSCKILATAVIQYFASSSVIAVLFVNYMSNPTSNNRLMGLSQVEPLVVALGKKICSSCACEDALSLLVAFSFALDPTSLTLSVMSVTQLIDLINRLTDSPLFAQCNCAAQETTARSAGKCRCC